MRGRDPGTFAVLFVCTGNICRSPMAERLFLAGLRQRLGAAAGGITAASAGTWGLTGAAMEPFAARAVRELGGSDAGFRARELSADLLAAADLVLCATREHRAAAVTLLPRVVARTFTLPEFARLCAVVPAAELPAAPPVERAAAIAAAAARARGLARPERPEHDDVPDPIGAPAGVFQAAAHQIAAALAGPLDLIAGCGAGAGTASPAGSPA